MNQAQLTSVNFSDTLQEVVTTDLAQAKGLRNILVQPKLDGVRAIWNPAIKQLVTKNGRPITSVPWINKALIEHDIGELPLDGELYAHGVDFDTINGAVRQRAPTTVMLKFHPFDTIVPAWEAQKRIELLDLLHAIPARGIEPVTTEFLKNARGIEIAFEAALDEGYEGIVLRIANSLYMPGKNYTALKIKPKQDAEFEFCGIQDHRSIMLKTPKNKLFVCRGVNPLEMGTLASLGPGTMVTVVYDSIKAGIPRFPRYKGLRHEPEAT